MSQNTELQQQNTIRQHLSPQQVRFVRLLEMTGPEIEEEIRREIDENPALEADTNDFVDDKVTQDGETTFDETAEQMQAADYDNEDDIPHYLLHANNRGTDSNDTYRFEQNVETPSGIEQLNEQLDVVSGSPRDIALARYIVGYLDENGRLSRSLNDIANDISIFIGTDISRADLLPALDIIRYELDPPGLGAVDLRECLLIQLKRRQPKTLAVRVAQEIIEHNFDVFTKKHFDRLQSILGVDKATLDDALEIIRSLDPKPGSGLGDNPAAVNHISPDFFVMPADDDRQRFVLSLNQRVPELAIEESFLVDPENPDARMFIKRKRDEANTFIGLIRRRSDTLMTVLKAIVSVQHRFFETEDTADIRPMILNDLSVMTGFDRSVISRATANKYVATQAGIYPMKMFFSDTPTDDDDVSASEIAAALKKIINEENKRRPLSDRALTEALNASGYHLARRTVTKYREKMNIPVARLRKEY